MDSDRISKLLQPFMAPSAGVRACELTRSQVESISIYIDILLRWNARMNLTSVRDPEEIVTRHFAESIFAARHLFPAHVGADAPVRPAAPQSCHPESSETQSNQVEGPCVARDVIDIGSGAGFPGLPIKILFPDLKITLIESNQKKSTFLREVIRALKLTDIDVFPGRAQDFTGKGHTVTLRAVDRFDEVLPVAAGLVSPTGTLALLISQRQLERAKSGAPGFSWSDPLAVPLSSERNLLIGRK